jgi:hypothetical protein
VSFSLREQVDKKITTQTQFKLTHCSDRLCVHDGHLWVPFRSKKCIDKYTTDGRLVHTLNLVQHPNALHPVSHDRFVMAADEGLYLINTDGVVVNTLATGNYRDVHVSEYIVALKYVDYPKYKVELYHYTDSPTLHSSFPVDEGEWGYRVLPVDNHIYVSFTYHVSKYSLQGNMICEYGRRGEVAPGELWCAYLCSHDTTGNILVVDMDNKRLQLLDNSGQWRVVTLPQCDVNIYDAVFISSNTLCVLFDNNVIKCYTFN